MVKIKDKQVPEGGSAGAPIGVLAFGMSQVDVDGTIGVFGTQQDHFVHCWKRSFVSITASWRVLHKTRPHCPLRDLASHTDDVSLAHDNFDVLHEREQLTPCDYNSDYGCWPHCSCCAHSSCSAHGIHEPQEENKKQTGTAEGRAAKASRVLASLVYHICNSLVPCPFSIHRSISTCAHACV